MCGPGSARRRSRPTAATSATAGSPWSSTAPAAARRCTSTALDAYVSQLTTSRYAGFAEHIASWDGLTQPLPADAGPVPALRTATAGEAASVMAPGDSQLRQRLFDRWIAELAIPLAPTVDGVRLSAAGDSAGTRLLLLESPEPLPFSSDVRLTVTHRVVSLPGGSHPTVPRSWLAFAAGLVFARTTVRGDVPEDIVASVRQAVRLVRAVRGDRLGTRIRYEVYAVEVDVTARGARLQGELEDVRPASPLIPTRLRPRVMGVGTVALLDRFGQLVGEVLPLPVEQDETVALTVIANGAEDKALLVPATPMRPDDYRFAFEVDRVRYRSAVVDDTTNYRASASWTVRL